MEKSVGFLFLLLVFWYGVKQVGTERTPPMFCTLPADWEAARQREFVASFPGKDSLTTHDLYLLSDSLGAPRLFYADILTPVCIDGTCKPVYIELYWDLTGDYAGYGIYEDYPLTKFDHDEFLPQDYQKMDRLLADNNSVLRRRTLSELFDKGAAPAKKIEYRGQELDAVSGATRKEIKESIIEGALYSCYTLWHLVHGPAARQMGQYLDSIYKEPLERRLLFSDHEAYYYHALKAMEPASFDRYRDRIADIFAVAKPLSRTYILKKMPPGFLKTEGVCRKFYQQFVAVDVNTKTLLINHLPQAHPVAVDLLSSHLEAMTKNQLTAFLAALPAEVSRLGPKVREHLQAAAGSQEYAYAYLIGEWLKQ